MAKILIPAMIAAMAAGGLVYRNDDAGEAGGTSTKAERKTREIQMDDGRKLEFGEKTRMKKDYGVEGDHVYAQIDLDNGKTVKVFVLAGNLPELAGAEGDTAKFAGLALQVMGHGLVQKLGDAAAGADSTEDAMEAILEVANRINQGEWRKASEGGSSAKGASELVTALSEYLSKDKDTVRQMLSKLTNGEKMGLRKVPEVATIIERLRAEKAPSKAEQEKVTKAADLLKGLAEGRVPEREETAA